MSHPTLVGIVGPLGPAQLACLRSWHGSGLGVAFFHLGGRRLSFKTSHIADIYNYVEPSTLSQECIADISALCTMHGVAALTTLSEHLALKLCSCRKDGGFPGTHLLLNHPQIYSLLESKFEQWRLAEQSGFPVLPTWSFAIGSAHEGLDIDYPVVFRPDVARLVRPMFKSHLVSSSSEALQFISSFSASASGIIAQPFISGPNLVIHGARAVDGSWDHHEAFTTEIKYNGLAVSLKPYPLSTKLLECCRQFEKLTGINGVFHYDFVIDERRGSEYFLELNPRLGGTTAKVYAAGYDEPLHLLAAHLPSVIKGALGNREQRRPVTSRIAAVKCALTVVRRPLSELDYPAGSRLKALASACKAMLTYSDEVFSFSDMPGNIAYLTQIGV